MPGFVERPLLFLDVDGTLVPFGVPPPDGRRGDQPWALPCDLVWATTWMADANEVIAPLLGLPELPMVDWPDSAEEHDGPHWKPRGLVRWAAGRPFVWVDDEITDADEDWVATHHPGRALLCRVEAAQGITNADLNTIDSWLKAT